MWTIYIKTYVNLAINAVFFLQIILFGVEIKVNVRTDVARQGLNLYRGYTDAARQGLTL